MNKSEFFVTWHMICREDKDNMMQSLDSIQGLYDECIVAVDDRPESDEVFDAIQIYPNLVAYRQTWPGRFDFSRQDVLNRVSPKATYIGCCDSDEVLTMPSARELRELLYDLQPRAVNLGIKYLEKVGPHEPGETYLRTKIWKTDHPRKWIGSIHEYPSCVSEFVVPTPFRGVIEFTHLKVDHKQYRSTLIIDTMTREIAEGHTRWYPYLAEEYRCNDKFDLALEACKTYLTSEITDSEFNQHLKKCLEEVNNIFECICMHKIDDINKWTSIRNFLSDVDTSVTYLKNSAIFWEYYALAVWYSEGKEAASPFHELAKSFDVDHKEDFIWTNDQFYLSE